MAVVLAQVAGSADLKDHWRILDWQASMVNSSERTAFVYDYTKSWLASVDESIDIVTDKLTKILAFSGVLLKFAVDMEVKANSPFFLLKFAVILLLMACVGFCAAGLWPKERSKSKLEPAYFVKAAAMVEAATCEQFQEAAVKAWLKAIPEEKQFRSFRLHYLNLAIGSLVAAGMLFGLNGIFVSIN